MKPERTRRRVLALSGSSTIAALAGCAELRGWRSDGDDETDREGRRDRDNGVTSVGTPIETFDDPFVTAESEWSGFDGASMEFTRTDPYRGERAVELVRDGNGDSVEGGLRWEPPDEVTLTDRDFSVAFRIEGGVDGLSGRVDLRLVDAEGHALVLQADTSSTSVLTESDDWMRIDFGRPAADWREADLERIVAVELDPWSSVETLLVDDFRTVPRADTASVVVDIDNPERKGDNTHFLDAFDRWGFPCVMGVDAVYARDEAETMDVDWLLEAQDDGHAVCSKLTGAVVEAATGVDTGDLTELERDQQAEAIEYNKRLLDDLGLTSGRETIIYTFNNWNADTRDVSRRHHSWGRDSGTGACGLGITEPFGLPGVNIDDPDVEAEKERIDQAVAHEKFLNLYLHPENVPESALDEILEHCREHVENDRLEFITHRDLSERSVE